MSTIKVVQVATDFERSRRKVAKFVRAKSTPLLKIRRKRGTRQKKEEELKTEEDPQKNRQEGAGEVRGGGEPARGVSKGVLGIISGRHRQGCCQADISEKRFATRQLDGILQVSAELKPRLRRRRRKALQVSFRAAYGSGSAGGSVFPAWTTLSGGILAGEAKAALAQEARKSYRVGPKSLKGGALTDRSRASINLVMQNIPRFIRLTNVAREARPESKITCKCN